MRLLLPFILLAGSGLGPANSNNLSMVVLVLHLTVILQTPVLGYVHEPAGYSGVGACGGSESLRPHEPYYSVKLHTGFCQYVFYQPGF